MASRPNPDFAALGNTQVTRDRSCALSLALHARASRLLVPDATGTARDMALQIDGKQRLLVHWQRPRPQQHPNANLLERHLHHTVRPRVSFESE